jgi:NAD(P)-dependent dehydrogenase (short-subunit alcohol dehydrogenase family)
LALSVETVELDVTNNASVDTAFKVVSAKTGGKLDVLVNNAGLAFGRHRGNVYARAVAGHV